VIKSGDYHVNKIDPYNKIMQKSSFDNNTKSKIKNTKIIDYNTNTNLTDFQKINIVEIDYNFIEIPEPNKINKIYDDFI